jgi:hypothetical protein
MGEVLATQFYSPKKSTFPSKKGGHHGRKKHAKMVRDRRGSFIESHCNLAFCPWYRGQRRSIAWVLLLAVLMCVNPSGLSAIGPPVRA